MTNRRTDLVWASIFCFDLVLRNSVADWPHWRRQALQQIKDRVEWGTHAPRRLMRPGRLRRLVWEQMRESVR